ncbi:hypothetical protein [Ruegeria sp.]|uniref:hypothetical protein n=1 Tax=Ruegeria sp. TaxID=1879320 RepID=UPI00231F30F7|nr:hypothetical protein [Ruegeria sp.]MDA7963336.1 hypothetical protein [Ruegeria sp.]
MIKKLSFATGLFFALTNTAMADLTIYDCTPYNIEKQYGWISERIIVIVDEETKSASVLDGYIQYVHKEPIAVSYSELKNGKFRVQWSVSGIPVRGNAKGSASWSATVSPSKAEMQVRATVAGFDNRPRGHGKCEVSREQ